MAAFVFGRSHSLGPPSSHDADNLSKDETSSRLNARGLEPEEEPPAGPTEEPDSPPPDIPTGELPKGLTPCLHLPSQLRATADLLTQELHESVNRTSTTAVPSSAYDAVIIGRSSASSSSAKHSEAIKETPKEVAEQLRAFATKRVRSAWEKLRDEFAVQKLIWQSQKLLRSKAYQQQLTDLEAEIESIMVARATDLKGMVSRLEDTHRGEKALLSNSMQEAIRGVIRHERCFTDRLDLAEKLDVTLSEKSDAAMQAELEKLLAACRVNDQKLDLRIRRALGLPIHVELGAAVSQERTESACSILDGAIVAYKSASSSSSLPSQFSRMNEPPRAPPFLPESRSKNFELSYQRSASFSALSAPNTAGSRRAPTGGTSSTLQNASALECKSLGLQRSSTNSSLGSTNKEKAIGVPRSSTSSTLGSSTSSTSTTTKRSGPRPKPRRWIV